MRLFGLVIILLVVALLFWADYAWSGSWSVATTGNDSNSGADSTNALLTIGASIDSMAAGDSVIVHGGVYDNDGIVDPVSGTSGDWSFFLVPAGQSVFLDSCAYGIYCEQDSFIAIEGKVSGADTGRFIVRFWTTRAFAIQGPDSGLGVVFPHDIRIWYAHFRHPDGVARGGDILSYADGSAPDYWSSKTGVIGTQNIEIGYCTFDSTDYPGCVLEDLDWIWMSQIRDYWIHNNYFGPATHTSGANIFLGHDGAYTDNIAVGPTHGYLGHNNRNTRSLIEDNLIYNAGVDTCGTTGNLLQEYSDSSIVRFNRMVLDTSIETSSIDAHVTISAWETYGNSNANGFYHNTVWINPDVGARAAADSLAYAFAVDLGDGAADGGASIGNNVVLNNIIASMGWSQSNESLVLLHDTTQANPTDFSQWWDGNCLWYNGGVGDSIIRYYYAGPGAIERKLSECIATYATQWGAGNFESYPGFEDSSEGTYHMRLGATSDCIDAAVAIDTVTATETNDSIDVGRCQLFWGGNSFVAGDSIIVGTDLVQITGVDYGNNILALSASIAVVSGDEIYLRKDGVTADDVGAVQYTAAITTTRKLLSPR